MLLGVFSDLHCNIAALELALDRMESAGVDEVLCAGDSIFEYRIGGDVLALCRERSVRMISGNHEMTAMGPHGVRVRAAAHVRSEDLTHLAELPDRLELGYGARQLLMVHGSPWEPFYEYLYPHHPKLKDAAKLGVDFLLMGHTHAPTVQRHGDTLVVNPGSLGMPQLRDGEVNVTFAFVDTDAHSAEIVALPDPRAS